MSKKLAWSLMAALTALDQASKIWVRYAVPRLTSQTLIPGFIDLTHVENPGVSFSIFGEVPAGLRVPLLAGVSVLAVLLIGGYWERHRRGMPWLTSLAFVMILAGAVGNLIDRVTRGTVTDFLHFRILRYSLFVNNLADILISLGVVAFLLGMLAARSAPGQG